MNGPSRSRSTTAPALALLLALAGLPALSQKADEMTEEPTPAERWQRAKTPGPAHRLLAARQGDYRLTSTFWAAPGAPPEVSHLPARRSLVLGGRALRHEVGPDARGFVGTGLEGYDNATGRYWYVWTDTSTTGLSVLYGAYASDGSGSFAGETPTPFGPTPLRVEIRTEGASEVHDYFVPTEDGGERRMLELRYVPAPGR